MKLSSCACVGMKSACGPEGAVAAGFSSCRAHATIAIAQTTSARRCRAGKPGKVARFSDLHLLRTRCTLLLEILNQHRLFQASRPGTVYCRLNSQFTFCVSPSD